MNSKYNAAKSKKNLPVPEVEPEQDAIEFVVTSSAKHSHASSSSAIQGALQ